MEIASFSENDADDDDDVKWKFHSTSILGRLRNDIANEQEGNHHRKSYRSENSDEPFMIHSQ